MKYSKNFNAFFCIPKIHSQCVGELVKIGEFFTRDSFARRINFTRPRVKVRVNNEAQIRIKISNKHNKK